MGLLKFINSLNYFIELENQREKKECEEEMNNYDLTEEEKELVRNGEYEPWSFESWEETELEEDDYYFDDEI